MVRCFQTRPRCPRLDESTFSQPAAKSRSSTDGAQARPRFDSKLRFKSAVQVFNGLRGLRPLRTRGRQVAEALWSRAKGTPTEAEYTEDAKILAFNRDLCPHSNNPYEGAAAHDYASVARAEAEQVAVLRKLCGVRGG